MQVRVGILLLLGVSTCLSQETDTYISTSTHNGGFVKDVPQQNEWIEVESTLAAPKAGDDSWRESTIQSPPKTAIFEDPALLDVDVRNQVCPFDHQCTYQLDWKFKSKSLHQMTRNGLPVVTEKPPVSARCTIVATPHTTIYDGQHIAWKLTGEKLSMKTDRTHTASEEQALQKQWVQCEQHVVQNRATGRVHAILLQQHDRCVPWMRNTMLGAAKQMTAIKAHSEGKTHFTRTDGPAYQHVQYKVQGDEKAHTVEAVTEHSQEHVLHSVASPPTKDMTRARTIQNAEFRNGRQVKHSSYTMASLGQYKTDPRSLHKGASVPRAGFEKVQPKKITTNNHMESHLVLKTVRSIDQQHAPHSGTVESFIAMHTQTGVWGRHNFEDTFPRIPQSNVASLSPKEQLLQFEELQRQVAEGQPLRLIHGAADVVQCPAVLNALKKRISQGKESEAYVMAHDPAQFLEMIGSFAEQRHMAFYLVQVASDRRVPYHVREQAISALIQYGAIPESKL
jgi:hypothetical protein